MHPFRRRRRRKIAIIKSSQVPFSISIRGTLRRIDNRMIFSPSAGLNGTRQLFYYLIKTQSKAKE
jgi:hypothetical protein